MLPIFVTRKLKTRVLPTVAVCGPVLSISILGVAITELVTGPVVSAGSSALLTAAVLVITVPVVKGLVTVTAKVTVIRLSGEMTRLWARIGGLVPTVPAPAGSRVILPDTKLV